MIRTHLHIAIVMLLEDDTADGLPQALLYNLI